jgi:hypothetical protein
LTGAASHDEVGKSDIVCDESCTGYLSNVVIDGDVGVVVSEDAARAWVNFTSEDDFVSGVCEAEVASSSA